MDMLIDRGKCRIINPVRACGSFDGIFLLPEHTKVHTRSFARNV